MIAVIQALGIAMLTLFVGMLVLGTVLLSRGEEAGEALMWTSIVPLMACLLCYVWM